MRLLVIITVIITVLQTFRVAIYYLRKDISLIKKIIETIILITMIILSYFNLKENIFPFSLYITLLLSFYILIIFLYEKLFKNEYISVLSVKKGIDMSDTGIMFLDGNDNIILINNVMSDILKKLSLMQQSADGII